MQSIFSPHLRLAQRYWKEHLNLGDCAVDATCGNGHDTLYLSQLLLSQPQSRIAAFDIQPTALKNTESLLSQHLSSDQMKQISFHCGSHTQIVSLPFVPRLIVYNLGYLPGGDKTITTKTETTLQSIKNAMEILAPDGALSITCYPGHEEGAREEKALLAYLETLSSKQWQIQYHKWINRPKSPTFLWVHRA